VTPSSLTDLRRLAVAATLIPPTTLQTAIDTLGFVQADPIRAPARAQDLTLRHRVANYRAGDLERLYPTLDVHEDHFINYGFLSGKVWSLMHPRGFSAWAPGQGRRVKRVLEFVRERGTVHPREVDAHFEHGTVRNFWGGSSSATTHLLEAMHYGSLLRVVKRETGIRIYAVHAHDSTTISPAERGARIDALIDVVVGKYAPLPAASFSMVISRLRYAVPQWRGELPNALKRAKARFPRVRVDGVDWYFQGEIAAAPEPLDTVRLLAPFDPIVWDRRRFEMLWGWAYRFEAYTPAPKRKFGYYALPLLWRDRVIGWANVSTAGGSLRADFGYVSGRPPRERAFKQTLERELAGLRLFLGIEDGGRRTAR
jgi:uncharacterized protein YcaQ